MSSEAEVDETIEVSTDGITVEKAFEGEEFPVPAIRFLIRSERDDAVSIRLSESIPEEFPMDGVGFHPDYENENWTAYQDHRVEFERTVDPGEEVLTVYGIRIESPEDVIPFLTDPELASVRPLGVEGEEAPEGEAVAQESNIDDIVDGEGSRAVKDMISGESEGIPGLDDESAGDEGGEGDDAPDLDLDIDEGTTEEDTVESDAGETDAGDGDIDLDLDDEDGGDEGTEEEPELELDIGEDPGDGEDAAADDAEDVDAPDDHEDVEVDDHEDVEADDHDEAEADDGGESEIEADDEDDEHVGDEADTKEPGDEVDTAVAPDTGSDDDIGDITEPLADDADAGGEATGLTDGSVAATLAEELRQGRVDEEDKAVLQEELDVELPGSDLSRLNHVQSRVNDLVAYTDALEDFLDEEGTGQQLIDGFRDDVEEVQAEMESVRERVETQGGDIDGLEAALERADARIDRVRADMDEAIEDVHGDVDDARAEFDDRITETESELQSDVDAVSDEVDTARDELGEELASVEGDLQDEVDDVRGDLEGAREDLDRVESDLNDAIDAARNDLGERIEGVAASVDGVADTVQVVEGDVHDVREHVEDVDDRLESVDGRVDEAFGRIEDLEDRIEEIGDEVQAIQEWRSELGSMFQQD